jgi:transposase
VADAAPSRRGPRPPTVELAPDERTALESAARRASAPQREALRARIVLLASDGLGSRAIAERLGIDQDTVGKWRRRFVLERVKGLRDAPRSGRPAKFSAHQKARLVEKATQRPREHGVPFSHWDAASLARLAVESGITDAIHPTTVWRWLEAADLKPHRIRYWLKCTDPDFEARMRDVTGVYLATPQWAKQGIAVFSVDEKTGIQALERKHPDLPMEPRRPQRREYEYSRHGTLCLTAAFDVATGKVQGVLTPDRPATVFARFLSELLASVPQASKVHVVADNLNTHWHHDACAVVAAASGVAYDREEHRTGKERRAFLTEPDKRVVLHFTPKHASWLNQIEIWFSVLGRKLLGRESFASTCDLEADIVSFIDYYNRHLAHPYRWTYSGTPCRT